jgi:hypothetical protein
MYLEEGIIASRKALMLEDLMLKQVLLRRPALMVFQKLLRIDLFLFQLL